MLARTGRCLGRSSQRFSSVFSNSHSSVQYDIVKPSPQDRNRVLDFLLTEYFQAEPIAKSIGGGLGKFEEKMTLDAIANGYSIMAVEKISGQILGVALNDVYSKTDDFDAKIKECQRLGDPYEDILKLFRKLDTESKFWEKLGVESCLRSQAICTHREYRNIKLATILLAKTLEVSDEYEFIRGESTNQISFGILMKQGWQVLHRISFQEHVDDNGKVIFNTEYPNTHINLIYRRLR